MQRRTKPGLRRKLAERAAKSKHPTVRKYTCKATGKVKVSALQGCSLRLGVRCGGSGLKRTQAYPRRFGLKMAGLHKKCVRVTDGNLCSFMFRWELAITLSSMQACTDTRRPKLRMARFSRPFKLRNRFRTSQAPYQWRHACLDELKVFLKGEALPVGLRRSSREASINLILFFGCPTACARFRQVIHCKSMQIAEIGSVNKA